MKALLNLLMSFLKNIFNIKYDEWKGCQYKGTGKVLKIYLVKI